MIYKREITGMAGNGIPSGYHETKKHGIPLGFFMIGFNQGCKSTSECDISSDVQRA